MSYPLVGVKLRVYKKRGSSSIDLEAECTKAASQMDYRILKAGKDVLIDSIKPICHHDELLTIVAV